MVVFYYWKESSFILIKMIFSKCLRFLLEYFSHFLCGCLVPQSHPLFATLSTAARQASRSFTISQNMLRHIHWVGDANPITHLLSTSAAFSLSHHQGLF